MIRREPELTIKELVQKLLNAPDLDKQVSIAIYHDDDSGDQEHYPIEYVVFYEDGSAQIKTYWTDSI